MSRKLIDDKFTTVSFSRCHTKWTQIKKKKINTQKAILLACKVTHGLPFGVSKNCLLCNCIVYVWCFTLRGPITISTTEADGHISLTFKHRIKSHLPFAGIIRSSPYSPRFQDRGKQRLFSKSQKNIMKYIQPTRCNNNGLLISPVSSTCFGQLFCPSSGVLDCVLQLVV